MLNNYISITIAGQRRRYDIWNNIMSLQVKFHWFSKDENKGLLSKTLQKLVLSDAQ